MALKEILVSDNAPVSSNSAMIQLGSKNADLIQTFSGQKDSFLSNSENLGTLVTRWNKLYPYQLVICQYQFEQYLPIFRFTLPMTPQELSIQTPFAITNTITADGVAEEHNGVKIKQIQLSGSLGSAPLKGNATEPYKADPNGELKNLIAGGTIKAITNLQQAVTKMASSDNPRPSTNYIETIDNYNAAVGMLKATYGSTGFIQHLALDKFLQSYAALKTTPDGNKFRLAFCIWKSDTVYLVTPVSYSIKRSVSSPSEYTYDLQLKAWKRITLSETSDKTGIVASIADEDKWTINKALKKLQDARDVIYRANQVIEAVRGDADRLMAIVRETVLAARDAAGVAKSIVDLPADLIGDFNALIGKQIENLIEDIKAVGISAMQYNQLLSQGPDKITQSPQRNVNILDAVKVDSIVAPASITTKVDNESARVASFTRTDWEQRRDTIQDFATSFANAVGAGDSTFNTNYNIPGSVNSDRTPTDAEYDVLFALNDLVSEIDQMIYDKYGEETDTVSTLDYVAGVAAESEVDFTTPTSKYPVPFPYGSTLEQLASIYLGNPDRWYEIATLNGLREPYVDEVGFDVAVVGTGNGNTIAVASSDNLYIGQSVWLSAPTVARAKRHILNVSESNGYVILTLDGADSLSSYSSTNNAVLHAFLPDTINSQMMIFIPSEEPPAANDGDLPIPASEKYDTLINVAGMDLLLTTDNDIVITPDGDGRWAYGLTHVIQRVRVVFSTPRGSLLRHPGFGVPVQVGSSVADLSMNDLKKMLGTLFADDPAFNSVTSVSLVKSGPALNVALGLQVTGIEQPIGVAVKILK